MGLNSEMIRWVEYSICERVLYSYEKTNNNSLSEFSFCERLRESIIDSDLGKRDTKVLSDIMYHVNRLYRLEDNELEVICANFFIDKKWLIYTKPIKLMSVVRWRL